MLVGGSGTIHDWSVRDAVDAGGWASAVVAWVLGGWASIAVVACDFGGAAGRIVVVDVDGAVAMGGRLLADAVVATLMVVVVAV